MMADMDRRDVIDRVAIPRKDDDLLLGRHGLDLLMPMHAMIDPEGRIVHIGPSLSRLAGNRPLVNRKLTDCFSFNRPQTVRGPADLHGIGGHRLDLAFRDGRAVRLRGVAAPLAGAGGLVLNLSLGLRELADLGGAGLTCTDFSATDMTVDMLYLIEGKNAAMTESQRLIMRLNGARQMAEKQAFTDTLTGLGNRRALDRALADLVAAGIPFALCNVDLDYFKQVNDRHGHAAGDEVLKAVAHVLTDVTRDRDLVARTGGDEFVILFRNLVDPAIIDRIARRLIVGVEQPITVGDATCRISASMGTALSTAYDVADPVQMMADADLALYASKRAGRSRHAVFDACLHVPPSE
ncbi:diguanylate cyclase [Oceaniovalibus guishaninsula JLT2003]|uniref:Diguanylate cyclase n=1 Tax=Oceaniovalibus guishaninsula JLT2003 TaxID=1231392 RepID=K2GR90_9RHOB|nr:GGDEF domain-containing protein [Oceaniovalibus guishaninsula]EKE45101.1 diguanylate cyclase [Oceaniovalibus guishaninsula JLT2003]